VGELADFSASINPLGPPDWLRGEVSAALSGLRHYPDPYAGPLCAAAAQRFGCAAGEVVAGNGSTELLDLAPALGLTRARCLPPAYGDYRRACELAGLAVDALGLTGRGRSRRPWSARRRGCGSMGRGRRCS
jgi:histidinol-phosphate/aromatic aminotransferase/cobyric acid decarboxylase-like protein